LGERAAGARGARRAGVGLSFRLVVEKGRSKGKALRLEPNGQVTVGRDQSCGLVVSDPQASRKHFRIEAELGEFTLVDLDSSNGTWVNGERVERRVLAAGDKVQFGETLVYFLTEANGEGAERKGDLTGREVQGYRIGRLLGRGAMGTVYEAVQVSLERAVAFKVLSPELAADPGFVDKFISEARAAGRLSHANIVAVFDVGQHEDLRFYSMEYMAGGSVEDLLRREGPLPFARTVPIVFDAARGLEFAEKHGVIHRDVKPDNLMLGTDGAVKICDLGIATHRSVPGVEISGSPVYLAPEHAQGQPIDHRVDLYSLGVSWYQMLAGEPPFSGRSPREVILKQIHEAPPPLRERAPEVPPDVAELVHRLLAKDPAERVPSARQLQADLLALARRHPVEEPVLLRLDAAAPDLPPSSAVAGDLAAPPAPAGRRRLALALVALLAALGLGAVAVVGAKTVQDAQAARAADARTRLDAVREVAEGGELAAAADAAAALEEAFRREGLPEVAREAGDLAVALRAEEEAARAAEAERVLARARTAYEHAADGPVDARARERLEALVGQLEQIVLDYGGTPAAAEAEELIAELGARLAESRRRERELAEVAQAARRDLDATTAAVAELLRGDHPDRFGLALERLTALRREHGHRVATPVEALVADLRQRASDFVDARIAAARRHTGAERWAEARRALAFDGDLGFAELPERLAEARAEVEQAEAAAARHAQEVRRRAARARLDEAFRGIAELRAERRYGEAARHLDLDVRPEIEVAQVVGALDGRVRRLQAAERALERWAAAIDAGELSVHLRDADGVVLPCTDVDLGARRVFLELQPGVENPIDLADVDPDALVESLAGLDLRPAERVDAAALAIELGRWSAARRLLLEPVAAPDREVQLLAAELDEDVRERR